MMSDTKREKSQLPFYELPPHIKPCSQIIHETRLQLKYSGKGGSDLDSSIQNKKFRNQSSGDYLDYGERPVNSSRLGNYDDDFGHVPGLGRMSNGQSQGGMTGIQAVHTKRPFTPRESVNFWGMSAQKRPPSAITLSRLSLDESDECLSTRSYKTRVKSPFKGHQAYLRGDSLDSAIRGHHDRGSNNRILEDCESDLEKTRLRFKALGSLHGKVENGDGDAGSGENESENGDSKMEELDPRRVEYLKEIYSIEAAGECLMNLLSSKEKVSKMDLIALLKRVKEIISTVPTGEPQKASLTKLIFKIVEKNANDEDVLFWSSFILLHCQIIGNNLTTIFKMVFKASRSQAYWKVIKETEYLDVFMYSLGEICPLTQTESMIYGYGTLKFICTEESVLEQVLALNLISVMALHLKILNCQLAQTKKIPGNIQNAVFQLTSILRSVVGIDSSLNAVAESGLLDEICNSLTWTLEDIDVISNIVRILSVVSSNQICCERMSENEKLCCAVVKILKAWHSKDSIVVRLTYAIGNLLARHNRIRIRLYQEPLALEMIIQVIGYYLENFTGSSEDILIKSIRILANWSLCPTIGRELCEVERVSELLNSLLEAEEVSTELLLCTISTLNNLSYHKDYDKLDNFNIKIAESLYNYLNLKNTDVRTEAMKVLGNLTRNSVVREAAVPHVGSMLISLAEENSELVCATIGVLMNIILDEGAKAEFARKGGVQYLNSLMENTEDAGLNLMICQLLWNFLISDIEVDETGIERCQILQIPQMDAAASHIAARLRDVESLLQKEADKTNGSTGHGDNNAVTDIGDEEDAFYHQICLDYVSVAKNLHDKLRTLVAKNKN